jgi:hypothetical protein
MSVTLYEPGLFALLDAPISPVGRYVTVKAEMVAEQARENVRANFRSRTGTLEQSIGLFPQETDDGLSYEVGTDGAPYGLVLEQGSTEHVIEAAVGWALRSRPGNPDPLREAQQLVVHPGNPPRPWLQPALENVFNGG